MKRSMWLLVGVLLALMTALVGGAVAEPISPDAAAPAFFIPGEPNDSFATANDAFEGYLMTPGDVDYLLLDLPVSYRLRPEVRISEDDGKPVVLRVELALYDAGYTLLAEDADCDATAALPDQFVAAGVYYLRVRACAGAFDSDQAYYADAFGSSWPYEWEPNNSRATANPFDDNEAAIQPAGDVDFYTFEGRAGESWFASLDANDDENSLTPKIALLNAGGTVLATGGEGYLYYDLTADGVYYWRVEAANAGGTGHYRLYGEAIDDPPPPDVEPNNTPAQAVPVVYGDALTGWFSDTDTIDYYRFTGAAGDQIALALTDVSFVNNGVFALYDPAMNPVPLNAINENWPYVLWAGLPVSGQYLVMVTPSEAYYGDPYIDYGRVLMLTGGDEPNNTMATATDIVYGPELVVNHDYLCDTDWYRFQGRAGDVPAGINTLKAIENVFIRRADGTPLSGHVLPADGTYYLEVRGDFSDKWDNYCNEGVVVYPFGEALWVSAAVDGLGGNKAIKRGDIATRKTAAGQWQIVFDASDVGITKNVNAFERMPNGSILMSLNAAQNVAGLGQVMPQDIIRFNPISLGDDTAGTFAWFLDGSDVGLSAAGEKIDAIYMQRGVENALRISTTGVGSVPRQSGGTLKFADEDIINLVGGVFGANSAGAWRMGLDGSTVSGLQAEDVSNLARVEVSPAHDSVLLVGLDSAFNVNGTRGTVFDVLDGGTWLPAVQRLTDKKIDGLAVGPAWTP